MAHSENGSVADSAGRSIRATPAEVFALVYSQLRRIAYSQLRHERCGHTLGATGLVHEAFLRLVRDRHIRWEDPAGVVGIASRAMRQILVDYERRRRAQKRGGHLSRVTLGDVGQLADASCHDLLRLDDALRSLEALDPLKASVVELRVFGGLTVAEAAAHLGTSPSTVDRNWRVAKAWLFDALRGETDARP